jgi:glycosyltransferase involved in cell wall biosynthesis
MRYIFLSSLFPKELTSLIENQSKGNIQYAANAHQWLFAKGFSAIFKDKLSIITAPILGSFPFFYKRIIINKHKFTLENNVDGFSVGYFNLAIVKNNCIFRGLKKALTDQIRKSDNEPILVIVYGMHIPYMEAALYAKKKFNNIKLCLIVPDLPEYMENSSGLIWNLRQIIQKDAHKLVPKFDSFVLLTDAMVARLNLQKKPWVRIEGMIDPQEHLIRSKSDETSFKKIVMYSGTLAIRYGILDLLEAFENIKEPEYELWICGAGNTEKAIKFKAKNDKRIRFFGLVSREMVLEMQKLALVLVNPRSSQSEYTKYSFPSKTMEYLLSGKIVIMRRLLGIPEEYHKYIYFTLDDRIESLQNAIVYVCEMSKESRIIIGNNAREFVLTEKNYESQTCKVMELIKSI